MNRSDTIDRHTPEIPPTIWQGLPPEQEATYTYIKNRILLPASGIPALARHHTKNPHTTNREITQEILDEAGGIADPPPPEGAALQALLDRGVTRDEVVHWGMLDARTLAQRLRPETVQALTLRLPPQLPGPHEVEGVALPVRAGDLFLGYATWVTNNPHVKYAFSIPHRLCYGLQAGESEVTVVEGVFDALALRRIGLNPLGMGDSQPNYFKMKTAATFPRVRLLFDDDLPGWLGCVKAYLILTKMLGKAAGDIEIATPAGGLDPEVAVRQGAVDFLTVTYKEAVERLQGWRRYGGTDEEQIPQAT